MAPILCPACGHSIAGVDQSSAEGRYTCPSCQYQGIVPVAHHPHEATTIQDLAKTTVELPLQTKVQLAPQPQETTAVTDHKTQITGADKTTVVVQAPRLPEQDHTTSVTQRVGQNPREESITGPGTHPTQHRSKTVVPPQGSGPGGQRSEKHTVIFSPGVLQQPNEWSGLHPADSKVWQTRVTQRFTLVLEQAKHVGQVFVQTWQQWPKPYRIGSALVGVCFVLMIWLLGPPYNTPSPYLFVQVDTALLHQIHAKNKPTLSESTGHVLLPAGATVSVLDRQGEHVVVQDLQGQVGYVPQQALGKTPPKRNARAAFVDCVRGFQEKDLTACLVRAERQWDACKISCLEPSSGCHTTCRARYSECEANCRERTYQPEPEPMQPKSNGEEALGALDGWRDKSNKRKPNPP